MNFSFFLSLAACRMRSSACDTLTRLCARHVLCWPAFPLVPALGSTGSAADRSALFVGFTATMAESDFPCPCVIGYGSSPSRCGPGRHMRRWPDAGSPSFRRDPFARDVAPRPRRDDNASHNGIAHVAFDHENSLRSRDLIISWLTPTPHATAVYASCSALPPPHATLASRRPATALPGPDLHRLIAPALPGAFVHSISIATVPAVNVRT